MTTYAITVNGVMRLEDGANIPNNPDNFDWQSYQLWLTEGGVPRPMQPSPVHIWNGTAWVIDAAAELMATAVSQLTTDIAAVKADNGIVTFLKMSPAEIDTYVNTNFTGAANANLRVVLKILGKTCAALGRREIANVG